MTVFDALLHLVWIVGGFFPDIKQRLATRHKLASGASIGLVWFCQCSLVVSKHHIPKARHLFGMYPGDGSHVCHLHPRGGGGWWHQRAEVRVAATDAPHEAWRLCGSRAGRVGSGDHRGPMDESTLYTICLPQTKALLPRNNTNRGNLHVFFLVVSIVFHLVIQRMRWWSHWRSFCLGGPKSLYN